MKIEATLASESIRIFLDDFRVMEASGDIPTDLITKQSGVFVTLELKGGQLRGRGGTIRPSKKNIATEIISAAIAAAFYPHGFQPIGKEEFSNLSITVDVVKDLSPVTKNYQIDSWREGVMVETLDKRQGIILPGEMTSTSMQDLVSVACRRGKINQHQENYKIFAFKTNRYS